MTSNASKKTRRRSSKRGGYMASLYNAASASLLPVGLTLSQQYYKNKSYKNRQRKFSKYRRR
jgi:hypothetical protein